jgi:hypothetical protein
MGSKTVYNTAIDNKIKVFNPRLNVSYDKHNDMFVVTLIVYNIRLYFNQNTFFDFFSRLESIKSTLKPT